MNVDGKTKLLGLVGDPVEHTLSPFIHNNLSRILDIDCIYVPFRTRTKGLADAIKGAYELNIMGLNITVPHKKAVMDYLISTDEEARAIGSVNTLVRTDGGYKGYNTDMMGLYRELMSYNISLAGRPVIVLGAGGAARAVLYMCMKYGASVIYLVNRTKDNAVRLAEYFSKFFDGSGKIIPMSMEEYMDIPSDKYIVFQATSIGLAPDYDRAVIEDERFYSLVDVGIDLIYNPSETKFMKLCKASGADCHNGLRMLLYQGITAYELWHDIRISDEMAEELFVRLNKCVKNNIILTGFMGSGKTTVGRALAEKYGYSFIDTDAVLEERAGCSISEIFERYGEAFFRNMETDLLKEICGSTTGAIISTGGGLPLRNENADTLKEMGYVVFLEISSSEVIKRLAGDMNRPLLAGDKRDEKVSDLLTYRNPIYRSASDITISVSGRSVDDIVKTIMQNYSVAKTAG